MEIESLAPIIRRIRKAPLHAPAGNGGNPSWKPLDRLGIENLIPHRDAMLLLESIDSIDCVQGTIAGTLRLQDDDPFLPGHFPGDPVYPGVLLVEAAGQLGLCLIRLSEQSAGLAAGNLPKLRATRIHHAIFFEPVIPGATVSLQAGIVEEGGLTLIAAGQVYQHDRLCAVSIIEVYIDDE